MIKVLNPLRKFMPEKLKVYYRILNFLNLKKKLLTAFDVCFKACAIYYLNLHL